MTDTDESDVSQENLPEERAVYHIDAARQAVDEVLESNDDRYSDAVSLAGRCYIRTSLVEEDIGDMAELIDPPIMEDGSECDRECFWNEAPWLFRTLFKPDECKMNNDGYCAYCHSQQTGGL